MNAEHLLTHFDRIADAPNAIPRLRRFILDLAVRGKLVEQDPNDEPVYVSFADGKRRNGEQYAAATLPAGWVTAPVGALLNFQYGKGMKASERLADGPVPVFGSNGTVGYCETPLTEKPSIIIGRKGSAGALNLCDGPSWTTDVAYFVEAPAFFDLRYLLVGLQTLNLEALGKGVKPGLSRSDAYELPLSVPPLAEQHRIVAKVDELMALCDRLETARKERETTRDRLAATSLAPLNAPDPAPAVFQNHAAFALNNLTPLTTRPDQIKALRQTILNLAVHGELVEQDQNDEPAGALLQRAKTAKTRVMAERKIASNIKPELSASADEDISPEHWVWTHLYDFALVLGGKRLPAGATFSTHVTKNIYIRVSDMRGQSISANDLKYISDEVRAQIAKYTIEHTDLYITIAGTIGSVGEVPDQFHGHNLTENAAKIVFREIDKKFLLLVLQSADVQSQFQEKIKQMAQPKLALKRIAGIRVPLPPLAEQHRIVAKVDELMAVCNRLEASLAASEETRGRLVGAVLREALAPDKKREGGLSHHN